MTILNLVCVERPQAPQHKLTSKYAHDVAILQPCSSLFSVDRVAWKWHWQLLMEVGGSWGLGGEVVRGGGVNGGGVNGGGSGELLCGGFGHGSWVTTM